MIQVVCAIVERGGYVLVARRGPDMRHPWKWEFPGGKIEPGESPETALHRELKEELDLEVEIIEPLPTHVHAYDDLSLMLIPFRCEWMRGDGVPEEHAEALWFDPGALLGLDFAEADIAVAEHYVKQFHNSQGGNQDRPLF